MGETTVRVSAMRGVKDWLPISLPGRGLGRGAGGRGQVCLRCSVVAVELGKATGAGRVAVGVTLGTNTLHDAETRKLEVT